MWGQSKQKRLQRLREAELQGSLTEAERADLVALTEERCRYEEAAIAEATRRRGEGSARAAAQLQQVESQNQALQDLIREQESYLAEIHALIAQMEARRQEWRERYTRVTGRPFGGSSASRGSR
jgi:hypothetical protein